MIWWRAEGTGGRWNGHKGEKQIPGQVADSGLAVRTVLLLTVCHPGEATWEPQSAFHSNQSEEAAAHDNVIHIEHGFKDDPSVVLQLLSLAANADPAAARKQIITGVWSPQPGHKPRQRRQVLALLLVSALLSLSAATQSTRTTASTTVVAHRNELPT